MTKELLWYKLYAKRNKFDKKLHVTSTIPMDFESNPKNVP